MNDSGTSGLITDLPGFRCHTGLRACLSQDYAYINRGLSAGKERFTAPVTVCVSAVTLQEDAQLIGYHMST